MGLHPNNVDVDFLVDLRTPLQLNGSWEVSPTKDHRGMKITLSVAI